MHLHAEPSPPPVSYEIMIDMSGPSAAATVLWRCSPSSTPTFYTLDLGVAAHATVDAIVTVVPWQLQNRFAGAIAPALPSYSRCVHAPPAS